MGLCFLFIQTTELKLFLPYPQLRLVTTKIFLFLFKEVSIEMYFNLMIFLMVSLGASFSTTQQALRLLLLLGPIQARGPQCPLEQPSGRCCLESWRVSSC